MKHKEKYPKITCIDTQERYDRVFGFMIRDSKEYQVNRNLHWWTNFINDKTDSKYASKYIKENKERITKEFIEPLSKELDEAKERRLNLTLQVLYDMENSIINKTTQGIWLSYPHTTEVVKVDDNKDKYVIVHLCTGEKFRAIRRWVVSKKANGKIYRQYYGNIELLEKLT